MRPGSAASHPDSTTSTGLLCLSVGARVHRGRSDTEVDCVATTMHILHLVHDTYIQLGEKVLQTVHQTFIPDIPVILHLLALVNSTIDINTPPTLYVIQEGISCMPTTDYFFTSIKPAPIVVTCPTAHHNKPTAQQAATRIQFHNKPIPCGQVKPEFIPPC